VTGAFPLLKLQPKLKLLSVTEEAAKLAGAVLRVEGRAVELTVAFDVLFALVALKA
jgi:hypothetical protein